VVLFGSGPLAMGRREGREEGKVENEDTHKVHSNKQEQNRLTSCCKHTNFVTLFWRMEVIRSRVSASSAEAG
jgi:hypothetical protein